MSIKYPGESQGYRAARDALLAEEIALRAQVAKVAEVRRALPLGGAVANYEFQRTDGSPVTMEDLFTHAGGTLGLYSLMFRPDQASPCPMCTSMLDGLDGQAQHISQNMAFAVVAAATPGQLASLAAERGWTGLTLLSAANNTYQTDYHAEAPDGSQLPMMNVFQKVSEGIRHFWGSEMLFAGLEGHPRHIDQLWPLWNMLDLTPRGRPDWFPALEYETGGS